ncbi:MAG: phytoene dehydrogenase, partial [Deltaproteobacteria bacterium]|nr:phytoene dehydrogenase [Deltaproteobacteria bacterium]
EVVTADKIISSAGYLETIRLCSGCNTSGANFNPGQLSFMESILILDKEPATMGYDTTVTFFNTSEKLNYQKPDDLVDVSSGLICCPNNFQFENPLPEGILRVTNLANFDLWDKLTEEEYKAQKAAQLEASLREVTKLIPDFRDSVVFTDTFTPKTIYKFTGHINGAIYGTPNKIKTGRTHLDNLFICGTDQGFLGIIGAMLSGIVMANLHVLQKT